MDGGSNSFICPGCSPSPFSCQHGALSALRELGLFLCSTKGGRVPDSNLQRTLFPGSSLSGTVSASSQANQVCLWLLCWGGGGGGGDRLPGVQVARLGRCSLSVAMLIPTPRERSPKTVTNQRALKPRDWIKAEP